MSFSSLRSHALVRSAGLGIALVMPLGMVATAAGATTPPTSSAPVSSTTTAVQTAAQKAAAAKHAAAVKAAKHRAAVKAAKKRAAAHRAAVKRHRAAVKRHRVAVRGHKMVTVAARYKGRPYRYGASGPGAFDCSGFTRFVARKALHVSLPHYAQGQAHNGHIKHVSRSNRKIGDLVFFHSGGYVFHVGIYAGHGMMWDAPHTGSHVKKQHIWSGAVSYGRIV